MTATGNGPDPRVVIAIVSMRGIDHQCQCSRPKFMRQSQKILGHVARQQQGLIDRIHKNRQSASFRPPLHFVNFFYRGQIKRVGGQAVNRVGGHRHHATTR